MAAIALKWRVEIDVDTSGGFSSTADDGPTGRSNVNAGTGALLACQVIRNGHRGFRHHQSSSVNLISMRIVHTKLPHLDACTGLSNCLR